MNIRKSIIIFVFLCLLFLGFGCNQQSLDISPEMAGKVAGEYLKLTGEIWQGIPQLTGKELTVEKVTSLMNPETDKVLGYVVHLKPLGFILTSAHAHVRPVIAHSFRSNFLLVEDPENMMLYMMRQDLQIRLANLEKSPQDVKDQNHNVWQKMVKEEAPESFTYRLFPPLSYQSPTGGWLKTAWRQGDPYNMVCPMDITAVKRSLTGCVATSTTQIINYWADKQDRLIYDDFTSDGDPSNNVGDDYISSRKNDKTGGMVTIEIDEQAKVFAFPNFDDLNMTLMVLNDFYGAGISIAPGQAAPLFFAVGVAVDMKYSASGSSSYNGKIATALVDKFGYTSADAMDYSADSITFLKTLQENNINGQPAALSIIKSSSGHSIVSDGFFQFDFFGISSYGFHLNYGWGTESPKEISHCWWFPPGGNNLPGDWILSKGVLNILPPPMPKTEN